METEEQQIQRFWKYVVKGGENECWIWVGYKIHRGYGRIVFDGKMAPAHRVSWEIHNKQKVPTGMCACHHCDNPSCVNPLHIFIGTPKDNVRDMFNKGHANLQTNPKQVFQNNNTLGAKLTPDQVIEIRKRKGESTVALAKEFGVCRQNINDIHNYTTWRWVALDWLTTRKEARAK